MAQRRTPKTLIKGFFKFCNELISAVFSLKVDNAGVFLIVSLVIISLTPYITHKESENVSGTKKTETTTKNTTIYNIDTSKKSSKPLHQAEPVEIIEKKKLIRIKVSSNLEGISELIERKIDPLFVEADKNHIDIDFSPYPSWKFQKKSYDKLAELKPGAIVMMEIKSIRCTLYVDDIFIPPIPKHDAGRATQRMNEEMASIVISQIDKIANKLKECLKDE
jgi:hypothetical protein